jgi:hypothetical protein
MIGALHMQWCAGHHKLPIQLNPQKRKNPSTSAGEGLVIDADGKGSSSLLLSYRSIQKSVMGGKYLRIWGQTKEAICIKSH